RSSRLINSPVWAGWHHTRPRPAHLSGRSKRPEFYEGADYLRLPIRFARVISSTVIGGGRRFFVPARSSGTWTALTAPPAPSDGSVYGATVKKSAESASSSLERSSVM